VSSTSTSASTFYFSEWRIDGERGLLIWVTGFPILAITALALYAGGALEGSSPAFLSLALAFELAAIVVGTALGVLFALPAAMSNPPDANTETRHSHYVANPSMTRLTEWITSAITGVVLVSIIPLTLRFWEFTDVMSEFGEHKDAKRLLLMLIVGTSIVSSFIGSYIKARTVLPALIFHREFVAIETMRRELEKIIAGDRAKTIELIGSQHATQIDLMKGLFWMTMHDRTQGAIEKSLYHFNQVLKREPRNIEALRELARAHKLRRGPGDLDTAARLIDEALQYDPSSAALHYNRACYLALLGRPVADWISSLKTAISVNSSVRSFALTDPDFESVRHNQTFIDVFEQPQPAVDRAANRRDASS
jgi:tetratricopeptide (TPR) repeat protein